MKFAATVDLNGKSATGFVVPEEVVEKLAAGKRPPVRVTVKKHTYRSTIARMGDRYLLSLSAENREAAGVKAGDKVQVEVVLDQSPREVAVPDDLAKALAKNKKLRAAFDKLAYSHRKEHVRAIEEAKKPETRARRLEKTLAMLREKA